MAWYWNLAAFFPDHESAECFAAFFRERTIPLPFGDVALDVSFHDAHESCLVGLWPVGMSYGSPRGNDYRLTEEPVRAAIVRWLDERLTEAPAFEAAFFGAEAYDGFLDEPLSEWVVGDGLPGLIVSERAFEQLGRPSGSESFAEGYRWWARRETP